MKNNKQIEELLSVGSLNRKRVDVLMEGILANICFSILNEVSLYIYKERSSKQIEYNSFCDTIFSDIKTNVKEAHKCKTFDEYNNTIMKPISNVLVILNNLANKYAFIREDIEDPELLIVFKKTNKLIYDKFFKKLPRKRKVKINGI